ncbi:protein phosphatase 2C 37-like [Senna tora]|uniref:protein-serine/threonine phosphatase n=1 Tax=Senna tora TaxID=362788 RepID=A0A834U2B4_9FABA|nr:protein phosphatase 2C 37-like [Senna tora]
MDGPDCIFLFNPSTSYQLYVSDLARDGDGQPARDEVWPPGVAQKSVSSNLVISEMAGICCGVVGEGETPTPMEPSRPSRRRRLDLLPLKYIADMAVPPPETGAKRQKLDLCTSSPTQPRDCVNAVENCEPSGVKNEEENNIEPKGDAILQSTISLLNSTATTAHGNNTNEAINECPKYGVTSVCGRRRDMEDAVSVHPSFCQEKGENHKEFHYFGVFDGHGCSHVATICKDRLHEIVKEKVGGSREDLEWKSTMEQSFARMDEEVQNWSQTNQSSTCRCELQTPHCDAVGSTAVVTVVTPDKIIVSNCGDSRAVLCRNGVAIPLSSDHKPDRPDELLRVQAAGGRVIYWDGPRVLGVLAMSRAIGDNYLKPYVISEPEVTVTDRTDDDECLILASDGLWDVVSNDTACGVVRMCLKVQNPPSPPGSPGTDMAVCSAADGSDKACSDASILLTKLALARHSTDNVSVVVVDLRREKEKQESNSNDDDDSNNNIIE